MDLSNYTILIPALALPVTAIIIPVLVIENTNNNLVCEVTGILNPVIIPLEILPIATIPVNAGANVTAVPAIGENILSGVTELYNCAVIVTVLSR